MDENLYCPRCGKQFSGKTSYCRTCGLDLSGVTEIVSGDAENAPVTSNTPNATALRLGLGLFLFGTALGLVNIVIRDLELFPEIYGKAVFIAFVIAGILSMGASVVFSSKKYPKRENKREEPLSPNEFETVPLAGELLPLDSSANRIEFPRNQREPVLTEPGSVVENTTRQLG